jgi:hypothetical protein
LPSARRAAVLLAVVSGGVLLAPSSALAARVWYVAPNGSEAGNCTQPEPCALKGLATVRSPEIQSGDTVMLAGNAGTYGSAGTPVEFMVRVREGVTFTGTPGEPMPKIYSNSGFAFEVRPSSVLSDIDVESTGFSAAVIGEGTISGVIARAQTAGETACGLLRTITDSVCAGTYGVAENEGGGGTVSTTLRNTTVYGSEYGLFVKDSGSVDVELGATNTIIYSEGKAGGSSVVADATESTSHIHAVINTSNYGTVKTEGPGGPTVEGAGNQAAPPLFVNAEAGDYREAPGSPTIDAGSDSPLNGPFDLEGNPRQIGPHTDIGAYEFLIAPNALTGAASPVGPTTATLNGTVNPNGLATSYHFVYGTTAAYGSATTALSAGSGTSPAAVSATLTGLAPNTTYHYQLLAGNSVGPSSGADQTFTTPPASAPGASPTALLASLGSLRISPNSFPAASRGPSATSARANTKQRSKHKRKTGATVSYTLNEAALVTFTIQTSQPGRISKSRACVRQTRANRHARRCKRRVVLGSFTEHGNAGANHFHFTGRLNGHALPAGSYTLIAAPTASGVTGFFKTASFRVTA